MRQMQRMGAFQAQDDSILCFFASPCLRGRFPGSAAGTTRPFWIVPTETGRVLLPSGSHLTYDPGSRREPPASTKQTNDSGRAPGTAPGRTGPTSFLGLGGAGGKPLKVPRTTASYKGEERSSELLAISVAAAFSC